jgi:precorrin-8X/cobalt-precorrin-8 methylmutase
MVTKKRALLLIDRGGREPEIKEELQQLCVMLKNESQYQYVGYSFLEVIPPYIEEGISKCLDVQINSITVMPYFLYPGLKLKNSVTKTAKLAYDMKINVIITKPLSYHDTLRILLMDRIESVKRKFSLLEHNSVCSILVVGHGSSDKAARTAFLFTVNKLKPHFKLVNHCFLELDNPRIKDGIKNTIRDDTKIMIIVPYFLHKGSHIKRDVMEDINSALEGQQFTNIFIAEHFGADPKLVDLVLERAKEAESSVISR